MIGVRGLGWRGWTHGEVGVGGLEWGRRGSSWGRRECNWVRKISSQGVGSGRSMELKKFGSSRNEGGLRGWGRG